MLLPLLTSQQATIIYLIYRFRFLNRIHIQTLLNHKDYATINKWLKYLTKNEFLVRIYSTKFGENNKPAVYYIGINGIRYLKTLEEKSIDRNQLQKLYHESYRSPTFRLHSLTLADFYTNLLFLTRKENKKLTFLTRVDFESEHEEQEQNEFLSLVNPDGYYTFSGTGIAKKCFIEVIDEHVPAFVLRGKVRRYIRAYQDENWEEVFNNKFPSIAFILPTEKKLNSMKRAITIVRNEFYDEEINENITCNLALTSDIQTKSISEKIWQKA